MILPSKRMMLLHQRRQPIPLLSTLRLLLKLPHRRRIPISVGIIPVWLHLCKAFSAIISRSWQQTAPVMSLPSPALPV